MGAKKKRLDEIVLERGLAGSRSEAKALIMTGKVRRGTERLTKAGAKYEEDIELEVEASQRFVGRGAEKLLGWIETFGLDFEGCQVLDIGACTGGFSDCALQHGAVGATCVDVGYGQLHCKLREDPRVTNLEKTNARYLSADILPRPSYERVVMDLSFISLKTVLPAVWPFLGEGGVLIALVKPQFEVGKEIADKFRGVIKDEKAREKALRDVKDFALGELPGAELVGEMVSPIKGGDGNVEFLIGLKRRSSSE
ncbi:TlyA family RNA methyltransferase [Pelagicoccus sp. SDUM812003]|uniref:TlyA family RNA methyltransferase n=1 Tax=Pelagicoccus sp. SDUM812003 TaxID=3041267 RepID=UPI00280D9DDD|nr:TlyA family RNA methyltransferase [Pelagicoccus sp. SDUM812003]MDQ8204969.1 TlyA family RNA methyltransferase [Pelagicoccus sp. SDUM812003]